MEQCVLVVIGAAEGRRRQVLALQAGDKESKGAWESVFADPIRFESAEDSAEFG